MTADWGFTTEQVHGGEYVDPGTGARVTPVHLTAGYLFDSFDQARDRFAGEDPGFVYTRTGNPTLAAAEARLARLEHGAAAVLVGSGQAANAVALLSLLRAGDHLLSTPSIYDGTRTLFRETFAGMGIEVEFVEDPNDPAQWRDRFRPTTRAVFGEAVPNPKNDLIDLELIAGVAHAHGVPFVVDSTAATPYLLRPVEHGVDVVVHSASKLLTGHGSSLAGAVVDSGRFPWAEHAAGFPQLSEPSHGPGSPSLVERLGDAAYAGLVRTTAARLGPSLSPLNAWLLLQGIETLSLRVRRHTDNALALATWLETQPEVTSVDHAGLPSSPSAALARRYYPRGTGSVFSFTLAGGARAARAFIDALGLFSRMTHIGDVRSMALHPATTTHGHLTDAERDRLGIWPGLIRLSVGIEDVPDLVRDLRHGLDAAALATPAERIGA